MKWFNYLYTRIVTGDGLRKSRLHTYSGRMIDLAGMAYLPLSVWSVFLLKLFGYRQRRPWLGYRAVKYLDSIIGSDWYILEFGSGMSSLFLAQRCRKLVSIESDPIWYRKMELEFAKFGLSNIDYRFRCINDYAIHSDLIANSFDLVIIDGLVRDQCVNTALEKVKAGGYVFLDNSDVPWDEFKSARETLTDPSIAESIMTFVDFYPFQIQVNESLLVRIKKQ
ncbi:MAG: class I SAM-dependent methyltransferase [Thermogemmata sp.]|nr:class I SAM-dependent methyltransferase [Thermogemmata sp.]